MLFNVHFFSSKCRLFHNATLFGFCITHILNTGCAKIWKKVRRQKVNYNAIIFKIIVFLRVTRWPLVVGQPWPEVCIVRMMFWRFTPLLSSGCPLCTSVRKHWCHINLWITEYAVQQRTWRMEYSELPKRCVCVLGVHQAMDSVQVNNIVVWPRGMMASAIVGVEITLG